ncbi:MAG: hypothetical protein QOH71_4611 [Blastocatellia bacterium]|nr:hypothetical protein [Blastocatellia bacterium]
MLPDKSEGRTGVSEARPSGRATNQALADARASDTSALVPQLDTNATEVLTSRK